MLLGTLTAATLFGESTLARAAELALASPFSDHMVLQRDQPVRIWGTSAPGAAVEVSVDGKAAGKATADAGGKWVAELPAFAAGGPHEFAVVSGANRVVMKDVLMGDVWLCSGQSNMQLPLRDSVGGGEAAAWAAKNGRVRTLLVPKTPGKERMSTFAAKWNGGDAAAAGEVTAVGMYFAKELMEKSPGLKDVPIGIIDSSFGGTKVEGWVPAETLAKSFKPEQLGDSMFGIKPSQLYNGMIAPLVGLRVKGVLWYQGESNTAQSAWYPQVMQKLIGQWREDFGDPKLPFYLVQLPNYPEPWEGTSFAWMREAQAKVAATTPNTAMAVALGTPDGYDLHPRHKRLVGERLALLARRDSYGEAIVASGPKFKSAVVEGKKIRVVFDTGGSAVAAAGTELAGFELAGEDGVYYHAEAKIEGADAVVVESERVAAPKTVRYAWAADPAASLVNREGIPAAPFRTDTAAKTAFCEIQLARPVRRVATPLYTATLEGDSALSSLLVNGQQFFSSDASGGFIFASVWGPRRLFDVTEISARSIGYSDPTASVTYTFYEDRIELLVENTGKEPAPVRVHLSTLVEAVTPLDAKAGAVFKRNGVTATFSGFDSVEKIFDVIYELKAEIAPGAKRTLVVKMAKTP